MDSGLLLKFIGYFPDYLKHCRVHFYAFLHNLCRKSCKRLGISQTDRTKKDSQIVSTEGM